MIRHVVLFTLKEPAQPTLDELLAELEDLRGAIPEIRSLVCGRNVASTPHSAVLTVDVDDERALRTYREHPAHQPVLVRLRDLAERIEVVDFAFDAPTP